MRYKAVSAIVFSLAAFGFLTYFAFASPSGVLAPAESNVSGTPVLILGQEQSAIAQMSRQELAALKSSTIAALPLKGIRYSDAGLGLVVEIVDLAPISSNGENGVQVFVRAWKNGKELGFGKDGTIETERIRIWNPPILVDDPNGNIVLTNSSLGLTRKLKEDPAEALKQDLKHTISIIGKSGTRIIPGTVGHTTDTFYPDAAPGTYTMNSRVMRLYDSGAPQTDTWANFKAGAANAHYDNSDFDSACAFVASNESDKWKMLDRDEFLFKTDPIGSGMISSATFSLYYGNAKSDSGTAVDPNYNVYASDPASNTEGTLSDFGNFGSTPFSTAKDYSDFTSAQYYVWSLNSNGLAAIDKNGITNQ